MKKINEEELKNKIRPVFIALVACVLFYCICNDDKEGQKKEPEFSASDALVETFDPVRNMLVSPSSAEFGYDCKRAVTQINDSTYSVHNTVDSQNRFGAMIRSHYTCKVIHHSNGINTCEGLQLLEL